MNNESDYEKSIYKNNYNSTPMQILKIFTKNTLNIKPKKDNIKPEKP